MQKNQPATKAQGGDLTTAVDHKRKLSAFVTATVGCKIHKIALVETFFFGPFFAFFAPKAEECRHEGKENRVIRRKNTPKGEANCNSCHMSTNDTEAREKVSKLQ